MYRSVWVGSLYAAVMKASAFLSNESGEPYLLHQFARRNSPQVKVG